MASFNSKKLLEFAKKLHLKELLALTMIMVAFFFFRQQRKELTSLGSSLRNANTLWIIVGVVFTGVYVLLQAALYYYSFLSVKGRISMLSATELFLKRNVISVFLPAGGISSLAYLPKNIRKQQTNKHQVHQASAIYGFIGIFSVFIVGIPVIIYMAVQHASVPGAISSLFTMVLVMASAVLLVRAIRSKGRFYKWLIKNKPKRENFLNEMFSFDLSVKNFWLATFVSALIEVTGIVHLYISMLAIGSPVSLEAAITGYIVATIFLIISPFMRGIGAVELSLTFILQKYGYSTLQAVELTLLFRLFEFWLPLLFGFISFAARGKDIFLRLLAPMMIFVLGFVNIFSALTPPMASRIDEIRKFVPYEVIPASNLLVILAGMMLIVTAGYLIRGLRIAWQFALWLSILSLVGHVFKGLDYEEAILSLVALIILIATYREYRLRSNPKLMHIGVATGVATFVAVLIFGSIAFHFLDHNHFHQDFTWGNATRHTFNAFFLIQDDNLTPATNFGKEFLFFIKAIGVATWLVFLYCIIKPGLHKHNQPRIDTEKAQFLLKQFGDSSLDYFKVSSDKSLFISEVYNGFISYRLTQTFAVVLEEPVCAEVNKVSILKEFEKFCEDEGYKPVYYCVDEESLYYFEALQKKKILIGREALVDITAFSPDENDGELRNALNRLETNGYMLKVQKAPIPNLVFQSMEQVSNEWLQAYNGEEAVFSQGMFDQEEVCKHDAIFMYDTDQRMVAFLTVIPDHRPNECTFNLVRKTTDAPDEYIHALLVEMIRYTKQHNGRYLNLGLLPIASDEAAGKNEMQVSSYIPDEVKSFSNYKTLQGFKEKYATEWVNKYLVYENDVDLPQLPAALDEVTQPPDKT
jgi:phosphatidylglycerol lysyltransferase